MYNNLYKNVAVTIRKAGISIGSLFLLTSTSMAQLHIAHGSPIKPMQFISIPTRTLLSLPKPGNLSIFYFSFSQISDSRTDDYLSALEAISGEISVYRIVIDQNKDLHIKGSSLLMSTNTEQLQPYWEIYLNSKENPILLVDRECKVVFCGILDSPENFNQILERLGIDFSLQQNVTFESFLTEYATLLQFKTGRTIDEQSYVKSKNSKIVLLYRSFCVPCGEDLLIKEILKYRNSVRPKTLDYICIFRRIGEKENLQLDEILESSDPDFMHIYEAQRPNPAIERFFLKGNPLLLIFDADNNLAKTRAINRMSPNLLTTVLNSIP